MGFYYFLSSLLKIHCFSSELCDFLGQDHVIKMTQGQYSHVYLVCPLVLLWCTVGGILTQLATGPGKTKKETNGADVNPVWNLESSSLKYSLPEDLKARKIEVFSIVRHWDFEDICYAVLLQQSRLITFFSFCLSNYANSITLHGIWNIIVLCDLKNSLVL